MIKFNWDIEYDRLRWSVDIDRFSLVFAHIKHNTKDDSGGYVAIVFLPYDTRLTKEKNIELGFREIKKSNDIIEAILWSENIIEGFFKEFNIPYRRDESLTVEEILENLKEFRFNPKDYSRTVQETNSLICKMKIDREVSDRRRIT